MCLRVKDHVVLEEDSPGEAVDITVDGKKLTAREGEKILSALLANGIIINRYTVKRQEPRGLFCGIGQCTDCAMIVNGKPNVRTCVTPVKEGMVIETQYGLGKRGGGNA
jgi:predicted molibdopterin-dependent oxidoreductase YjgC